MTHPVELAAARVFNELRLNPQIQHDNNQLKLVEGAYISWDDTTGEVSLTATPELGALLHLEARVPKAPAWLALNLELADADLCPGDILGLALQYEGCAGETLAPFLRTARDGILSDTVLQDTLEGSAGRATQVLLHQIRSADPAAGTPGYHTLVLPLPKRDFALAVHDMQLFVIPASRGLQLGTPTLGAA